LSSGNLEVHDLLTISPTGSQPLLVPP
jgi:hypothetical protein